MSRFVQSTTSKMPLRSVLDFYLTKLENRIFWLVHVTQLKYILILVIVTTSHKLNLDGNLGSLLLIAST